MIRPARQQDATEFARIYNASVALHEKFGMEKVAHFKEVGRKFDRWVDVGDWQYILDD